MDRTSEQSCTPLPCLAEEKNKNFRGHRQISMHILNCLPLRLCRSVGVSWKQGMLDAKTRTEQEVQQHDQWMMCMLFVIIYSPWRAFDALLLQIKLIELCSDRVTRKWGGERGSGIPFRDEVASDVGAGGWWTPLGFPRIQMATERLSRDLIPSQSPPPPTGWVEMARWSESDRGAVIWWTRSEYYNGTTKWEYFEL